MKKNTAKSPKLVAKPTTVAPLKVGMRKNSRRRTGSRAAALDHDERRPRRPQRPRRAVATHHVAIADVLALDHRERDACQRRPRRRASPGTSRLPSLRVGALGQRTTPQPRGSPAPKHEVEPEDPLASPPSPTSTPPSTGPSGERDARRRPSRRRARARRSAPIGVDAAGSARACPARRPRRRRPSRPAPAISVRESPASAPKSEPAQKSDDRRRASRFLRPSRSPSVPPVSISAVKASM